MISKASRSARRPLARRAVVIIRLTSSGVRYSRVLKLPKTALVIAIGPFSGTLRLAQTRTNAAIFGGCGGRTPKADADTVTSSRAVLSGVRRRVSKRRPAACKNSLELGNFCRRDGEARDKRTACWSGLDLNLRAPS